MDESQKKIAELEAKLMLAARKSETDEEMRKKDEEVRDKTEALEQAQSDKAQMEAEKSRAEADLAAAQAAIAEKDTALADRDAAIIVKDARIAELEAQIAELEPFKIQAETLEAERAAAELAAKQQELTHFCEAHGLDPKAEAIANAIQNVDYAALISEANRNGKNVQAQVASYVMGSISAKGEYDDLLEKA